VTPHGGSVTSASAAKGQHSNSEGHSLVPLGVAQATILHMICPKLLKTYVSGLGGTPLAPHWHLYTQLTQCVDVKQAAVLPCDRTQNLDKPAF
jgi:hypothetical protein